MATGNVRIIVAKHVPLAAVRPSNCIWVDEHGRLPPQPGPGDQTHPSGELLAFAGRQTLARFLLRVLDQEITQLLDRGAMIHAKITTN